MTWKDVQLISGFIPSDSQCYMYLAITHFVLSHQLKSFCIITVKKANLMGVYLETTGVYMKIQTTGAYVKYTTCTYNG